MASAAAQPATAATSASHPYTCNTCQVAYRNTDLQKTHMKSDWHRYNLKRRVASLPPISSETFTDKVLQARAATTAEADKAYFERKCDACQKTYYSENAYQNHLLSQKHKANQAAAARGGDESASVISSTFTLGEPLPKSHRDSDSVDAAAEEEFNHVIEGLQQANLDTDQRPSPVKRPSHPQPKGEAGAEAAEATGRESNSATPVPAQAEPAWSVTTCLFCNYSSPTLDLNTQHMERFHGMFIPEKTYLVNMEGLIDQLQRKVHEDHECLSCGKFKTTVFGVQTHMRDKGHCKIPFDTEEEQLEIGDHYDFRSTYSDDEEEPSDDEQDGEEKGGARLGARRAAETVGEDGQEIEEQGDGEGWETDSDESSLDSEDLTSVPAEGHQHQYDRLKNHPHHSSQDAGSRHKVDGWHSHAHKHTHAVFHDEYELHLPSGKSVGHRSLNKYYRQNLTNYPTPEERAEQKLLEEAAAEDGDNEVAGRGEEARGRAMVPRGAVGMAGVPDHERRLVARSEQKARTQQNAYNKKADYIVGKKLNNHKNYYYREKGGG